MEVFDQWGKSFDSLYNRKHKSPNAAVLFTVITVVIVFL